MLVDRYVLAVLALSSVSLLLLLLRRPADPPWQQRLLTGRFQDNNVVMVAKNRLTVKSCWKVKNAVLKPEIIRVVRSNKRPDGHSSA